MNPGRSHQTMLLYALAECEMTLDVLGIELDLTHRQVSRAAEGLIRKGLAERVEKGCYRLTAEGQVVVGDGGTITSGPNQSPTKPVSPHQETLRQRAWNAMRIQQKFTIPDLILVAAHGEEENAHNNLSKYCSNLSKVGILRLLRGRVEGSAPSSNGFKRYQLLQDLGEIAPVLRRGGAVYDHNSDQEFQPIEVSS